MDSIPGYHDKSIPTRALRKWLNSEWTRLRGSEAKFHDGNDRIVSPDKIFNRSSIPMIDVKVPKQGCGEGVVYTRQGLRTICTSCEIGYLLQKTSEEAAKRWPTVQHLNLET